MLNYLCLSVYLSGLSSFIIKKSFIYENVKFHFFDKQNYVYKDIWYDNFGIIPEYHIISWLFTIIILLKFILNCGWIYVGWLAYDLIWSYPLLMFSNKLSYICLNICLCCNFNFHKRMTGFGFVCGKSSWSRLRFYLQILCYYVASDSLCNVSVTI